MLEQEVFVWLRRQLCDDDVVCHQGEVAPGNLHADPDGFYDVRDAAPHVEDPRLPGPVCPGVRLAGIVPSGAAVYAAGGRFTRRRHRAALLHELAHEFYGTTGRGTPLERKLHQRDGVQDTNLHISRVRLVVRNAVQPHCATEYSPIVKPWSLMISGTVGS